MRMIRRSSILSKSPVHGLVLTLSSRGGSALAAAAGRLGEAVWARASVATRQSSSARIKDATGRVTIMAPHLLPDRRARRSEADDLRTRSEPDPRRGAGPGARGWRHAPSSAGG